MAEIFDMVGATQQIIDNTTNNEILNRQQIQQDLANRIAGYQKDSTGKLVPNARGQLAEDANRNKLELTIEYQQKQLEAMNAVQQHIVSKTNTDTMNKLVTTAITTGDYNEVNKILNTNPVLKETLKSKGVLQIAPVDWVNDRQLYSKQLTDLDITEANIARPQSREALDKHFFKVLQPDGQWHISSTAKLFKDSNTAEYIPQKDTTTILNELGSMRDIMVGNGLIINTPNEVATQRGLENQTNATNAILGETDNVMAQDYQQYLVKLQQENPNITLTEALAMAKQQYTQDLITTKETAKAEAKAGVTKENVAGSGLTNIDIGKAVYQNVKAGIASPDHTVPMDTQMVALAQEAQGKDKMTKDLKKTYTDSLTFVDKATDTLNTLDKVTKTAGYNAYTKFVASIQSKYKSGKIDKDEALKALSGESSKFGNTVAINSKLGSLLATYLKATSGLVVSDKERETLTNVMLGGQYSASDATKIALSTMRQGVINGLDLQMQLDSKDYPMDVLWYGDIIAKKNWTGSTVAPKETTGTQKPVTKVNSNLPKLELHL